MEKPLESFQDTFSERLSDGFLEDFPKNPGRTSITGGNPGEIPPEGLLEKFSEEFLKRFPGLFTDEFMKEFTV